MKTYRRILKYVKPYTGYILLHTFFVILAVALLATSIAFVDTVLRLLSNNETTSLLGSIKSSPFNFLSFLNTEVSRIVEQNNGNKLPALGFAILAIVLINVTGNLFKFIANFNMSYIRTKVVEDIRRDVFDKMTRLQISYYEGERKGDLLTRLTSDLSLIESTVVVTLETMIRDPFTVGAFLFLMFKSSFQLTLLIFILLPVSAFLISRIARSLRRNSFKTQNILSWIISVADEFMQGVRVVKAFNAEPYVKKVFAHYNHRYSRISRRQQNKEKSIPLISESLGIMTIALFLWFGGKLVFKGEIESSQIVTFVLFFQQIMQPTKNLTAAYGNIMKGIASGERLFALKDAEVTIIEKPDAKPISHFEDGIYFKNVSFAYNNEFVLKKINLHIPKGKIIALAGPSGSGKTTLAELIPRFYDVTKGAIFIDGNDIRDLKVFDLRNLIAIVTQEPILFNDTILNNIRFGQESASEEEVINAAIAANAHEFIMETEEGYQTNIGDRGGLLSGGQRQRLSIARAILKNPSILILDEATSSLDTASEAIVQDALYKLMRNRTSLVIAHRLSTIQNADQIIVLDKGEIVQRGTHHELFSQPGLYRMLCEMQQLNGK